jgi:hypothetical protein
MIRRYRELAIVVVIALASVGAFLIYISLTNSRSEELDVIGGACCCALALILCFHLVFPLRGPAETEFEEHEESGD